MKFNKPECGSLCYHMYTCDTFCYDNTNGHICKHIHHIKSLSYTYDKENSQPENITELPTDEHSDHDTLVYPKSTQHQSSSKHAHTQLHTDKHSY